MAPHIWGLRSVFSGVKQGNHVPKQQKSTLRVNCKGQELN